MRHILGAVVAGGLILGLAAPSRAQFQLNIGNPYGGGYGNGIGFGGGAYNYGGSSPYGYNSGYSGYNGGYGYGTTAYSTTNYGYGGPRYYNSGYSGYAPPVVNYAPVYRPVVPVYQSYGYGGGYGRGYGGYGRGYGGYGRGFRR